MKKFNTTGTCIPEKHFMVISKNKLSKIMNMVENGEYFTINKPRQYGKTTTLYLLDRELKKKEDYFVIRISFEGMGDERFKSEKSFIEGFFIQLKRVFILNKEDEMLRLLKENKNISHIDEFGMFITELIMLSNKKVVLLIDEIDKNSDNQLFLNFLGLLRTKYLMQNEGVDFTFHSVILAGVHDVKNLKLKIRSDEERKYNSPWNIAANFNIDMNFTREEIKDMLQQYSNEKNVLLDAEYFSDRLFYYTNGYPFLVSRLCEFIDEEVMNDEDLKWEKSYIETAVKSIINESNTNYESLTKNLENNTELYKLVYRLIIEGVKITYNAHNPVINLGFIYGILDKDNTTIKVNNRIYEQIIYDYMISKIEISANINSYNFRENFLLKDGTIDFEKVLLKFQEFMKKEYSTRDEEFLEKNGRLIFLAFIKPIINGVGFDFKEVQISEEKRLDVVITYLNKQYVIEMKIWRGPKAHSKGINQLYDYLDAMSLNKGYLVIFDFNKSESNRGKRELINLNDKEIFAIWV